MAKRKVSRANSALGDETASGWRRSLEKRSKAELVEFILEMGRCNRSVREIVQSRFDLDISVRELIEQTRSTIDIATDFDDRDVNSNFDYDSAAYQTVERNFARLISMGKLTEVMELALRLMRDGSRQVECSDEGMMTDEIEGCLEVVIKALKKGTVPASEVVTWCTRMIRSDRVGFICDKELRGLRETFAAEPK